MAATDSGLNLHERAITLYLEGQLGEAAQFLSDAIVERPTSELWNDWSSVQTSLGELLDAERGFLTALRLDPQNAQAAANLGAILFAQGRLIEAAPHLHQALNAAPRGSLGAIEDMLRRCGPSSDPVGDGSSIQLDSAQLSSTRLPSIQLLPSQLSQAQLLQAHPLLTLSKERKYTAPPDAAEVVRQWKPDLAYDQWFVQVFRQQVRTPGARLVVSWEEDSPWGLRAYNALELLECEYATQLLTEIRDKRVPGDIAEFGIYQGWWMNLLWQTTEQLGLLRRIYGFDSFAGLSEPHPEHDQAYWKKGQYACSLEQVSKNLQTPARPRIKLVQGFFEKSLRGPDAQLAERFAYVRIDCDIYEPALDCLRYLGPRLADGAILVFDDWPHLRGFGEQRAFEEWLPTVPNLDFEFLFYGPIGHFYLRVHHRK